MTRYRIITNPASRRGSGAKMIPLTEEKLRNQELDFDLVSTERPRSVNVRVKALKGTLAVHADGETLCTVCQ